MTLHRLRHLLRTNAAVHHNDGKLSLNGQLCWLDVWQFERAVSDGLHTLAERKTSEARVRSALDLYTGHFLALEAEESWMIEPRIRWKMKFERVVTALTAHVEQEGRFADAIDLFLQTQELDPFNELLYQRLMNCYLKRGEFASALGTYLRCREALTKGLCAPTSSETERLRLDALSASGKGIAHAVGPAALA